MDINEFNESLEGLVKQAERLNAGETSLAWDYNGEWQVKIVVKRKRKKSILYMDPKENKLILYKYEEGKLSVNTLFADEDVWLTQAQLVEIYQSSKSNISEHLTNIFCRQGIRQRSGCSEIPNYHSTWC